MKRCKMITDYQSFCSTLPMLVSMLVVETRSSYYLLSSFHAKLPASIPASTTTNELLCLQFCDGLYKLSLCIAHLRSSVSFNLAIFCVRYNPYFVDNAS